MTDESPHPEKRTLALQLHSKNAQTADGFPMRARTRRDEVI
jgi:hypothetical protein